MQISVVTSGPKRDTKPLQEAYQQLMHLIHYEQGFPMILVIGSALTVASCAIHFSQTSSQPAVALGSLLGSVFLLLLGAALLWGGTGKKLQNNANLHLSFSFVVFASWTVFCMYTTFVEPFVLVGPGYVSVWLGFCSSFGLLSVKLKQRSGWVGARAKEVDVRHLLLVLGSSLVLVQGSMDCCSFTDATVATAFGGTSLVSMLIFMAGFEELYKYQSELGAVLSLIWISGVFFLNFDYFGQIGNGFFGCWICAVCSLLLV